MSIRLVESSFQQNGDLNAVLDKALELENLTKSNAMIANSLFSGAGFKGGSSNGKKITRMGDVIQNIKDIKVSADTSSARNNNTKFSYKYHIIYMLFKIIGFCIVFYFIFKRLLINESQTKNGEGIMQSLSRPIKVFWHQNKTNM